MKKLKSLIKEHGASV